MKKNYIEILKELFGEDNPSSNRTSFYRFGGREQSKRKREFIKIAKEIAKKKGIPGYQGDNERMGVRLGQRYLEPLMITGTETFCEQEDLHQINNPAIQQLADDIKRTAIACLDTAHRILMERVGISISPESINYYLEVANHTMAGGAVAQEHMGEVHPSLTKDSHVKLITGDDELADQIDRRFLIDIDEYPEEKAEKLKKGVGKHLYQVARIPTIAVRIADGGITRRWHGNQTGLAFLSAYRLGGGAILSEFSFALKHAQNILLGTITWDRYGRGLNEPQGVPYGYMGDICQADLVKNDPVHFALETTTLAVLYLIQMGVGAYQLGGVALSTAPATVYTNNIFDTFAYHIAGYVKRKYGGFAKTPPSFDVIMDVTLEANKYISMEYDKYPLLLEHHWGGPHRAFVMMACSAIGTGLACGDSLAATLASNYTEGYFMKEIWGRGSFGGGESGDHIIIANIASVRPEEGYVPELRGRTTSGDALSAINTLGIIGGIAAAHAARGDAWCLSPVVKVAFSDPHLAFNFREIRKEIAKGALRAFIPEGDRDPVKPAF
ncbi:MAG: coenzyme-B sulfoethylthiotransferase subunit alpha [Candidatus Syntropharchaeia archaeon]